MVTPRKRRTRHTDALDFLNGINRHSTRATRKRRQTAPRSNIYDVPVSPEKPTNVPNQKETTSSLSSSLSPDGADSAQEPSEHGPDQQPASEDEEWVEAQEPSNEDDDDGGNGISEGPRNDREEEPGDPFPGHVKLFSDGNEVPNDSNESSPPETSAESTSEAESVPISIPYPGPGTISEARSNDGVAVVIPSRGSEHQADIEGRDTGSENTSNPEYDSAPETPPAQPPYDPFNHEYAMGPDERSGEDDSGNQPDNEDEDIHETPIEIPTMELNRTENEGNGDGSPRELRHWFLQEIDGSAMETEWRTLYTQGTQLKRYQLKPLPEYLHGYLQGSRRLIAQLREVYKEIIGSRSFTPTQEEQFKNICENIYADVKQIFEYASEKTQDASVLDQFEAHMIPKMMTLVQFSFRAFTTLGGPTANQLHGTLDLVLRCSVRVNNYRISGLLPAQARSRTLHLPLKRLMAALKAGQLNGHLSSQPVVPRPKSHASQSLTQGSVPPSQLPWTPVEEEALLDGLRQYTGELYGSLPSFGVADRSSLAGNDRFVLIIRHLGHRFRGRTERDLKAKSQEFRRHALRNGVLDRYPWL